MGPPCQSGACVAGEWEHGSAGAGLRERTERGSWAAARGPVRERKATGRAGLDRLGFGLGSGF